MAAATSTCVTEIPGSQARITCFACLGGLSVTVPEGIEVDVSGFSLIGGRDVALEGERRRPGTPLIHIRAYTFLGGIAVRTPERKLPN